MICCVRGCLQSYIERVSTVNNWNALLSPFKQRFHGQGMALSGPLLVIELRLFSRSIPRGKLCVWMISFSLRQRVLYPVHCAQPWKQRCCHCSGCRFLWGPGTILVSSHSAEDPDVHLLLGYQTNWRAPLSLLELTCLMSSVAAVNGDLVESVHWLEE